MNSTDSKTKVSGHRRKVMVAEDDPAILDSVKILLEMAGYEVSTTVNGQAIRDLHEDLPDIILLDLWLSGTDGREICRWLKSQKLTKRIPVVIFSANNDIEKIAKECGANDFLPKPFEIRELLGKIGAYSKLD